MFDALYRGASEAKPLEIQSVGRGELQRRIRSYRECKPSPRHYYPGEQRNIKPIPKGINRDAFLGDRLSFATNGGPHLPIVCEHVKRTIERTRDGQPLTPRALARSDELGFRSSNYYSSIFLYSIISVRWIFFLWTFHCVRSFRRLRYIHDNCIFLCYR